MCGVDCRTLQATGTDLRKACGYEVSVFCHDVRSQVIECMLGLAIQHQDVAERGGREGGCLEQVAQLPEAACWIDVHAEQR